MMQVGWQQDFFALPGSVPGIAIPAGLAVFAALCVKRLWPLGSGQTAPWRDRPWRRLRNLARLGLLQSRQPRYFWAALAHGCIFYGLLFSLPHLLVMVCLGLPGVTEPAGALWRAYSPLCDVAATAVIIGCTLAAICRIFLYPQRYPAARRASAFGILFFVILLTASEIFYRGAVLASDSGTALSFSLAGATAALLAPLGSTVHAQAAMYAWHTHELLFFGFLCILPVSKQFHEILGLPSLWAMRLDKGAVKPCRYDITEGETDKLPFLGVATMRDFTWKQMLNFYSCADCGRCTDNCPAALAGRELSPREFTFKGRCALEARQAGTPWTAREIWDCTLCGACEEECPLGIGYIDAMVDLRRNAVETGAVPRGLGAAMERLQRGGSPVSSETGCAPWPVGSEYENRAGTQATLLYLPSAFTVREPSARRTAEATCRLLTAAGHEIGLLPFPARDSGHEARRWGDEYLFRALRDALLPAILASGAECVTTEDPHTLNALKNDFSPGVPVTHTAEVLARDLKRGALTVATAEGTPVHAFHDPCFLGRHNGIYQAPRDVFTALGLIWKELPRNRDRAFCCGGPGAFFHEVEEKKRPAAMRVEEATGAGVGVLITACPWCGVNLRENARSLGLNLEVCDIAELVARHMVKNTKTRNGSCPM